ncbi:MAG: efflux RND transporter periplasmic adaptor subunit [Azospirillaceae bacterium]|nr:efflux RND transporter periplasmic adaptor subunit [Azospirillaceae bacterium]
MRQDHDPFSSKCHWLRGFRRRVPALALLAVGVALTLPHPGRAQTATPVTTAKALRQDVPVFAAGIGNVQAFQSVLIRARVDGYLARIDFTEGQEVKRGDLLAEIDPRPYAAALAQAQAKRAADQVQLDNARRDLARYSSLAASNFASHQQVDTQQATAQQLQATLQGDNAAVDAATLNLDFCKITAPIDGVAGLRLVDVGNLIQASAAQGIVSILQVRPIAVVFTLPQQVLPAIRAAQRNGRVPVLAFAADEKNRLGQGELLTTDNTIDTTTGTITLKARFDNPDGALWPGQFVSAHLQLRVDPGAVTVPPIAVQHGPDGLYVFQVRPDHTVAVQPITVGYQNDTLAIVTKGLAADDEVVVAGQSRLQNGTHVASHPADQS